MFENRLYAELDGWDALSDEKKAEVLEQARYLTYTGSRWNNLLPVFYILVGIPLLLVVFILLPYLFLWESIFVVPVGVLFIHFLGNAIYHRIHAKLMRPAVYRLLEERAGPRQN